MVDDQMNVARPFAEVDEAIAAIRAGKMVVVVDDEDRENEGDLTLAAEFVTPRQSTSWRFTDAGGSV